MWRTVTQSPPSAKIATSRLRTRIGLLLGWQFNSHKYIRIVSNMTHNIQGYVWLVEQYIGVWILRGAVYIVQPESPQNILLLMWLCWANWTVTWVYYYSLHSLGCSKALVKQATKTRVDQLASCSGRGASALYGNKTARIIVQLLYSNYIIQQYKSYENEQICVKWASCFSTWLLAYAMTTRTTELSVD